MTQSSKKLRRLKARMKQSISRFAQEKKKRFGGEFWSKEIWKLRFFKKLFRVKFLHRKFSKGAKISAECGIKKLHALNKKFVWSPKAKKQTRGSKRNFLSKRVSFSASPYS
jgi:hypothetical protein